MSKFTYTRLNHLLVIIALLVGVAFRIWQILTDYGIYWPDEIYQSIAPAHKMVFGHGFLPWEFIYGMRNWAFPGFIALLLKISSSIKNTPEFYLTFIKSFFAITSLLTSYGCYLLTRSLRGNHVAGLMAAVLTLLSIPLIYFSHRALTEVASMPLIVFGLYFTFRSTKNYKTVGMASSLLALAVILRPQNAIFALGMLIHLLIIKDYRAFLNSLAIFIFWAFILGFMDYLTWGQWFYSSITYLKFNLIQQGANLFGTEGPSYYFMAIYKSIGAFSLFLLSGWLLGIKNKLILPYIILAYFLAHQFLSHKEFRFIIVLLPLLFSLTGIFFTKALKLKTIMVLTLFLCFRLIHFSEIKMDKISHIRFPLNKSAFNYYGDINRLLLLANKKTDLCGLKIDDFNLIWSGGYSYLHQNVPLYGGAGPGLEKHHYNYLIMKTNPLNSTYQVATIGQYSLLKLPFNHCKKDEHFSWRIDPTFSVPLNLPPKRLL